MISISIVSHGHGSMVAALLEDLVRTGRDTPIEVILTNNIPAGAVDRLPAGLAGRIVNNAAPLGFGHNHNNALLGASGSHFCVLNPDIRLPDNPFPVLLQALERLATGVVAPAILSPAGRAEDSARRFPTPWQLLRRRTGGDDGRYRYERGAEPFAVDWVAGMFMTFRADEYRAAGGFDQRYFLYCEDLDLCARLWRAGREVVLCPRASAIHDARRDSHRSLRFLRWHLRSYARFFASHGWRPDRRIASRQD